jgi:hypothetical protein
MKTPFEIYESLLNEHSVALGEYLRLQQIAIDASHAYDDSDDSDDYSDERDETAIAADNAFKRLDALVDTLNIAYDAYINSLG